MQSAIDTTSHVYIRGLLRYRELRLADVVGKRKRVGKSCTITYLISNPTARLSPARLPDDVAYDETFNAWLASVPDLDAIDKEKRRAAGKLHFWED